MNTVPATHGITECRHCQFCSPLNDIGVVIKGFQGGPPYGTCRYATPIVLPTQENPELGSSGRAIGRWPLVVLTEGNGCRMGVPSVHPVAP